VRWVISFRPPWAASRVLNGEGLLAETRFEFGANWIDFVGKALNDRRVASAVADTRRLLRCDTLQGRSFLDVGCGSGLFSLAAHALGAERVVSFDFDPRSVSASEILRSRFQIPADRWAIHCGSVLDEAFLDSLDPADVVYSWGVLHHTGDMWKGIANAARMVRPGGHLAISIYNRVTRFPDRSTMWWEIKRFYVRAPGAVRSAVELGYVLNHMATRLISLRNPLRPLLERSGEGRRGMDFWHDARDWLGGFPYEFATAGEVFEFVHGRLGMELIYLNTVEGNACNEFLFRHAR
ncbi:MAG: class I SAM-dependent methyltransferase, partial [Candidatus Eiseniibacteriota bacterium]